MMPQNPFWDRIQKVRQSELDILWKSFRVATFNSFLLNAIPTFVSVATFTTYVLLGNKLTAAKAFTSLSLFSVHCHLSLFSAHCHPTCSFAGIAPADRFSHDHSLFDCIALLPGYVT